MQTNDRQHFEPLPSDIQGRLDAIEPRMLTREAAKAIVQEAPRRENYGPAVATGKCAWCGHDPMSAAAMLAEKGKQP